MGRARIVQHEQYHKRYFGACGDSHACGSHGPDNGETGAEGQRGAGAFPEVFAAAMPPQRHDDVFGAPMDAAFTDIGMK
jgi:hypothetical protein